MTRRLHIELLRLSWREWRHHPWRHGVAALAVALGVALAWSVHLINESALAEFSSALRAVGGEPDLVLRAQHEGFDDAVFERVALDAAVAEASPVVEVDTYARGAAPVGAASPDNAASDAATPRRIAVRVLGVDSLRVATLAPQLLPQPAAAGSRFAALDPGAAFINATARTQLKLRDGDVLALQAGPHWRELRVAGSVAASGPPLVVMDVAGAQLQFEMTHRLSRIDVRFVPGTTSQQRAAALARWALPAQIGAQTADESQGRVASLSRAYRVNLTVLALVALFVGAFLVFAVVSLSVAQRMPALALLGVLGLTRGERRASVLMECAALGMAGSALGLLLGTALAAAALRWLAGDLGGGYFPGIAPQLQVDIAAATLFFVLGVASALVGGWVPARHAERMAPALVLKGLGARGSGKQRAWPAALLLATGTALAFVPPLGGLPLAAYAAIAALLFGGVLLVPLVVHGLLSAWPTPANALALLALRRASFERHTAIAAVAGVVASLALSVALTVMVTSFRGGVADWLDSVLPADLYARSASTAAASNQAWFDEAFARAVAALPGVARVQATRSRTLQLAPGLPAVVLVTRPAIDVGMANAAAALPLVGEPLPARPGEVGVYVSEAVLDLYGTARGAWLDLPLGEVGAVGEHMQRVRVRVLGVWRDFARQFGAIAIDAAHYQAITGDRKLNDLALWLKPGADMAAVQRGVRALLSDPSMIEFAASGELRALSLRIFDRSFAVTTYLQAVAIAIGLVGVAASLSAQVLARRKEFGLLSHLGLRRAQVVAIVAAEGAAWLVAGVLIGLALGVAVSVVLVYVVNPQSFHWSMSLRLPWRELAALCLAVLAAGVATAAISARQATGRAAVLSVKEDW